METIATKINLRCVNIVIFNWKKKNLAILIPPYTVAVCQKDVNKKSPGNNLQSFAFWMPIFWIGSKTVPQLSIKLTITRQWPLIYISNPDLVYRWKLDTPDSSFVALHHSNQRKSVCIPQLNTEKKMLISKIMSNSVSETKTYKSQCNTTTAVHESSREFCQWKNSITFAVRSCDPVARYLSLGDTTTQLMSFSWTLSVCVHFRSADDSSNIWGSFHFFKVKSWPPLIIQAADNL